MLRFQIGRIPVTVQWWFWLLAAFLGGAPRAHSAIEWQRVLVFVLAAFVGVLAHELGHALTGLKLGARQSAIVLHGMGGFAVFPGAVFTRWRRILMTAAGPATGFLLSALAYGALVLMAPHPSVNETGLYTFAQISCVLNFLWSLFNLFPILPLDGGRILSDLLGPQRIKITCVVSYITLLILGGLLWYYTESVFNLILIGLFASHTFQVWQAASGRANAGDDR